MIATVMIGVKVMAFAAHFVDRMNLKGHFLIAMPGVEDQHFARTVVFICNHDENGAMGFIVNQPVKAPAFTDILNELKIKTPPKNIAHENMTVFCGGPVEQGRGFVIHSLDYSSQASIRVDDLAGVSATIDALRRLASDNPPQNALMMLGYSGWSAGQLEDEVLRNGWLTLEANAELLFYTPHEKLYDASLTALGVTEAALSSSPGHA
ncbi:MAG: YqgE/AlgH family protein [Pseudomonadota bacterium]